MSYLKYNVYKKKIVYSVHVLCPLREYNQCPECDCSESQVFNEKISTRKYVNIMGSSIDIFKKNIHVIN